MEEEAALREWADRARAALEPLARAWELNRQHMPSGLDPDKVYLWSRTTNNFREENYHITLGDAKRAWELLQGGKP